MKKITGIICLILAVLALTLVLLVSFSGDFYNKEPGIISKTVLRISRSFEKQEKAPDYPEMKPLKGIFLSEKEERKVLRVTAVVLCILSFVLGLVHEKNIGSSIWVPGGIMLSAFSLFMLYPLLALVLTLIAFIALLKLREKRLKALPPDSETKPQETG